MFSVLLVGGVAFLAAYLMNVMVPSGSPTTMYLTLASVMVGAWCGVCASTWWPIPAFGRLWLSNHKRVSTGLQVVAFIAIGLLWLSTSTVSAPWTLGAWFGYAMPTELSSAPATLAKWPIWTRILTAAFLVYVPVGADVALRALTLDITDAIGDFNRASTEDAWQLQRRLCWDGKCLARVDWACGFETGNDDDFNRCFETISERASESTPLDAARKYCGNSVMQFVGEAGRSASHEQCIKLGGEWGRRSIPPAIEFRR